jgi:tRNA (cmo5U34)-methyltransferase
MSHSVESHLQLKVTDYDELIRKFIPRYDEMLDEAVLRLRDSVGNRGKFVDLGIGTGALTERVLQAIPLAEIIGIDADPKMLEEATRRLSANNQPIKVRVQDFLADLPAGQNGYFAALALHHVLTLSTKQKLYRKIYQALLPGGLFLNADALFDESEQIRKRWAAHLVSAGFTETEASNNLESWKKEDRYYGIETELALLRNAGFVNCDVAWRYGPMAIVVGTRAPINLYK